MISVSFLRDYGKQYLRMPQHTLCHLPIWFSRPRSVVHVHFCPEMYGNPEVASACVQQSSPWLFPHLSVPWTQRALEEISFCVPFLIPKTPGHPIPPPTLQLRNALFQQGVSVHRRTSQMKTINSGQLHVPGDVAVFPVHINLQSRDCKTQVLNPCWASSFFPNETVVSTDLTEQMTPIAIIVYYSTAKTKRSRAA